MLQLLRSWPVPAQVRPESILRPVIFLSIPTPLERCQSGRLEKTGILSLGGQAILEITGMEKVSEKIIHRVTDLEISRTKDYENC